MTIAGPRVPLAVTLGSPTLRHTRISVADVRGDQVTVRYQTLPGSRPHTFGDVVGVWSGSMISPGVPPIGQAAVAFDQETGSVVVSNLTITASSYTAGYALGGDPAAVCAAQLIGAGGQLGPSRAITLSLDSVDEDSVSVAYETLPGLSPQAAGSWVGLWRGQVNPYALGAPITRANVTGDANEGNISLIAQLAIKSSYSLVYFLGAAPVTAGAMLDFRTA
jgi:hypothetical protein